MDDLISRQAAIDALGEKPLSWTEGEYELGLQNQWQSDVDALNGLPSAQPERKRGEWILAEDGWYCSVCELYPPFDCDPEEKGISYCPYCGAKMDEDTPKEQSND